MTKKFSATWLATAKARALRRNVADMRYIPIESMHTKHQFALFEVRIAAEANVAENPLLPPAQFCVKNSTKAVVRYVRDELDRPENIPRLLRIVERLGRDDLFAIVMEPDENPHYSLLFCHTVAAARYCIVATSAFELRKKYEGIPLSAIVADTESGKHAMKQKAQLIEAASNLRRYLVACTSVRERVDCAEVLSYILYRIEALLLPEFPCVDELAAEDQQSSVSWLLSSEDRLRLLCRLKRIDYQNVHAEHLVALVYGLIPVLMPMDDADVDSLCAEYGNDAQHVVEVKSRLDQERAYRGMVAGDERLEALLVAARWEDDPEASDSDSMPPPTPAPAPAPSLVRDRPEPKIRKLRHRVPSHRRAVCTTAPRLARAAAKAAQLATRLMAYHGDL